MAEATVDCLNLKSTEFYKNLLKPDEKPGIVYPKNILEYKDDALFAWNHGENCLMVLLTKTLLVDEVQIVQKLRPTEMILTEVVRLVLNHQNTRIAICCRNDVYIMDLPPRSGRHGQFKGSAHEVTCSCKRLYVQCALTTIRQVYWHPDLDYDYYLAILTSDDLLQISDVQAGSFVDTWVLSSGSHNRLPSLESIGEVAVDFHFIPQSSLKHILPVYTDKVKQEIEPIEWPALILYGNGDVVMIDLSVKHEGRKYGKTTSPLLMYPSAEDNYGVDCSGILILDGCLPIVIIASSTGIIYHSILLNHPASDYQNYDIKKSNSIMNNSNSVSDAVYVLHVIESIELDIGLNLGSNSDDTTDEITSSPIKLIEDHTCNMRYFAIHASGVHSVNLPIVNELGIFFSKNYKSVDLPPQALLNFKKIKCVVEYIVCSQITGKKPSPVIGAISIECPTTILVVLFLDNIFSLRVTSWFISTPSNNEPALSPNSKDTLIEEVKSVSFQESVESILKPDSKSVPIFKMGNDTSPTPQQCLELLARATSYFREMVIPRHEQAAQLVRTKARMLVKMKGRQLEDLKPLEDVQSELKDKARYLAEKYEDINEKQIELAKRAERVLRALKTRERGLTKCEKIMVDNLLVIQNTVDGLTTEVDGIRLKETTQDQIISSQLEEKLNKMYLTDNHLHIIASNLSNMTSDINNVVMQVQDAEAELGFDIRLNRFQV